MAVALLFGFEVQFFKLLIWEREKIAVIRRHGSPSGG
jgi:hypothetical protein